MSDCVSLSDRMPAAALGRAEWTADEARHLEECRSCRTEWELVQVASRLGDGLIASHDTRETARAVLDRLKYRKAARPPRVWTLAGLAAAAAIVAAVWIGRSPQQGPNPETGSVVVGLQLPLPELESLQSAELDTVLRSMDESLAGGPPAEFPVLEDLEIDELQRVLDSWEG